MGYLLRLFQRCRWTSLGNCLEPSNVAGVKSSYFLFWNAFTPLVIIFKVHWLHKTGSISVSRWSLIAPTPSPRGQCHLNKKNVAEALLFEGKALLSRSLAMERGIGALDDARVKAQTAWRQQC